MSALASLVLFFFNDTATTEIYTLSLHDALPIWLPAVVPLLRRAHRTVRQPHRPRPLHPGWQDVHSCHEQRRSEEHTSELQSQSNLVCRLLLEKKKAQRVWHRGTVHARLGPTAPA